MYHSLFLVLNNHTNPSFPCTKQHFSQFQFYILGQLAHESESGLFSPKDWQHLALSMDAFDMEAVKMKVFITGELKDSFEVTFLEYSTTRGVVASLNGILRVGAHFPQGEMHEIRFWAVCREIEDIKAGLDTYLGLAEKKRFMVVFASDNDVDPTSTKSAPALKAVPLSRNGVIRKRRSGRL